MRMGQAGPTAADLVNMLPEAELADVLYTYGEERASRRIARRIVLARAEAPITSTTVLARLIRASVRADKSGLDPATRSFQALRIRVNDELGEIERGLAQAAELLRPGGRLVVVSFHSLEDRIVKRFMTEAAGRTAAASRHDPGRLLDRPPARFRLLTAKAVRPGDAETQANPRARSSRLRAIERTMGASDVKADRGFHPRTPGRGQRPQTCMTWRGHARTETSAPSHAGLGALPAEVPCLEGAGWNPWPASRAEAP